MKIKTENSGYLLILFFMTSRENQENRGVQAFTRENRGMQGYSEVNRGLQCYKRYYSGIQG